MANNKWQKQYYSKKKKDNGFLKVKPGCNLTVRLVGGPVKIVRIFTNDDTCIVIDSENTAYQLKEKYPKKIGNISVRYACWCFDRHDNRIKVLEMPKSVFSAIGQQSKSGKKKISDLEEGCDFSITTNGEKGMNVRYTVNYLEETALNGFEQHIVEDRKTDEKRPYDLTKMFVGDSFLDASVKLSKVDVSIEMPGALWLPYWQ